MASIRSSGGILAPPLLRRMLDLARRGRQSCPAFDRAVALSATLPLLSADAGRRRRRPRESGDAGGAPCAGQPIGSARCSERAGSSRTAAVDSIARGCAPSAPCARRAHNFPLRRRSPANLGSQPTSVAPGVAVPRYKVRSCLGCAPSSTHSHLSCLPIPPALPISPASPSPTPPSHLSCLLIEMADRRHQQITLLQGMRPPPCTRCQSRCKHYLCPNCAINLSPCMSPIGGLGNPNAMCCNCWCEEVCRCVMGCMMSDSSSDDDVSDYESRKLQMLKRKVRGTKKRLVAVKADQIYQARKIYKMTKNIDDLKKYYR
ncbi:unnamed protein product [Urochloa humidicola]